MKKLFAVTAALIGVTLTTAAHAGTWEIQVHKNKFTDEIRKNFVLHNVKFYQAEHALKLKTPEALKAVDQNTPMGFLSVGPGRLGRVNTN